MRNVLPHTADGCSTSRLLTHTRTGKVHTGSQEPSLAAGLLSFLCWQRQVQSSCCSVHQARDQGMRAVCSCHKTFWKIISLSLKGGGGKAKESWMCCDGRMGSWAMKTSPDCAGTGCPSHPSFHVTSPTLPFTLMLTQMTKLINCCLLLYLTCQTRSSTQFTLCLLPSCCIILMQRDREWKCCKGWDFL